MTMTERWRTHETWDDAAASVDAYFPGPKSENAAAVEQGFGTVLQHWFGWRTSLFADDPAAITASIAGSPAFRCEQEKLATELRRLCDMLRAENPAYTPRYIGHMQSEISLPALFGHLAALVHNPNNTSREVSKVGAQMETEAIAMLAAMLGFDPANAQGHFTCGGTVANFEAVWRARYRADHALALSLVLAEQKGLPFDPFAAAHMGWDRIDALREEHCVAEALMREASAVLGNPFDIARRISARSGRDWRGPVLIVPGSKHYSWRKAANLFGLGEQSFWNAPLDREGRADVLGLKSLIERARTQGKPILCIASVAGSTEAGKIDPVDGIADLLDDYKREGVHIWHHVDAAYGGFFCSMLGGDCAQTLTEESRAAISAIGRADSVTIDPHKLGYTPYACGAFLTKDECSYLASTFHAPYIDRADPADKWRSTIEGSRSAAGAAATWLTGKTIGFDSARFGKLLAATIAARRRFEELLSSACGGARILSADTNILCFSVGRKGEPLSMSNRRTEALYAAIERDPEFALSKTQLSAEFYGALIGAHAAGYGAVVDTDNLSLLRCVFMNPYFVNEPMRERHLSRLAARIQGHIEAHSADAAVITPSG